MAVLKKSILAGADVPDADGVVEAAGEHELPGGVERDGDHLRSMALRAASSAFTFNSRLRVFEYVTSRFEFSITEAVGRGRGAATHRESGRLLAALDVPEFGRVVHAAGRERRARRVERHAHHLCRVPAQRVEALARLRRPDAALLVERAGRHLVTGEEVEKCRNESSKNRYSEVIEVLGSNT